MKVFNTLGVGAALYIATVCAHATDLLTVYQQAALNAPIFKSYQTTSQAAEAGFGASLGNALPTLAIAGTSSANSTTGDNYNSNSAAFTLTQPVFDVNTWSTIAASHQTARAAYATYQANVQQFILTVATDYFTIRENQDMLNFSHANVAFLKQTLAQTKVKFKVGLATITDVKQAESDYDSALATLIQNQNNLADSIQTLAALTGKTYTDLAGLVANYPFTPPQPDNICDWVKLAKAHNWTLLSANYTTGAQYRTVLATAGNQLPSVSLVGTYAPYHNNATGNGLSVLGVSNNSGHASSVALQLSWTVFQSGGLALSTLQAAKTYEQQEDTALQTYRTVISQTRQDYLSVIDNLNLVQAYQQSVLAADLSLKQNLEQYKVGTQTIVQVLNAVETLYQAQQNLVQARYDYILSMLQLKLDAGTLSPSDLIAINRYLTH